MRDPARIPAILAELRELWEANPDQRLGQILENYVFYSGKRGDQTSCALFYQEDDVTLANLKRRKAPATLALEPSPIQRNRHHHSGPA